VRTTGSGELGIGSGVESAGHGGYTLDEGGFAGAPVGLAAPTPLAPVPPGATDCGSLESVPRTLPPHAAVTAIGASPTIPRRSRGTRLLMRSLKLFMRSLKHAACPDTTSAIRGLRSASP
jgi:hypothetical protein